MYDIAIVGAGPAGMSAAVTASRHGLSVVVVDEQQRPGGQIFRQPPRAWETTTRYPAHYPWGRQLVETCERSDRVAWRLGATALGVLRDDGPGSGMALVVRTGAATESVSARRLLIATGAMDLPVAFPGWTLPGVVTAGGIQTMAKSQQLLLAQRVVLSGSHPLLVTVADLLLSKGADIAGIAIARRSARPAELARSLQALPGNVGTIVNGAAALRRLLRAKVPIARGAVATAARGDGRVEEVDICPVDPGWNVTGPPRTVAADGLVVGYGFQPSTDLARQLGCELRWDSPKGGWIVAHDRDLATTVPDVSVAGEPTGIAGAEQSCAEGRLAALTMTAELAGGSAPLRREIRRARRAVAHAARFSGVVQKMFEPPRQALLSLATSDTVICRCETKKRQDIEAAISANTFLSTVNAVKLQCRAGMGSCQGRYCELAVAGLLARARELPYDHIGNFAGQFPVRPVSVAEIAALDTAEEIPDQSPASPRS